VRPLQGQWMLGLVSVGCHPRLLTFLPFGDISVRFGACFLHRMCTNDTTAGGGRNPAVNVADSTSKIIQVR